MSQRFKNNKYQLFKDFSYTNELEGNVKNEKFSRAKAIKLIKFSIRRDIGVYEVIRGNFIPREGLKKLVKYSLATKKSIVDFYDTNILSQIIINELRIRSQEFSKKFSKKVFSEIEFEKAIKKFNTLENISELIIKINKIINDNGVFDVLNISNLPCVNDNFKEVEKLWNLILSTILYKIEYMFKQINYIQVTKYGDLNPNAEFINTTIIRVKEKIIAQKKDSDIILDFDTNFW